MESNTTKTSACKRPIARWYDKVNKGYLKIGASSEQPKQLKIEVKIIIHTVLCNDLDETSLMKGLEKIISERCPHDSDTHIELTSEGSQISCDKGRKTQVNYIRKRTLSSQVQILRPRHPQPEILILYQPSASNSVEEIDDNLLQKLKSDPAANADYWRRKLREQL